MLGAQAGGNCRRRLPVAFLLRIAIYHDHVWGWGLLAVAITIAGVKLAAMVWYRITD
jgi:hypothetical protein